jgi:hypothetical protein
MAGRMPNGGMMTGNMTNGNMMNGMTTGNMMGGNMMRANMMNGNMMGANMMGGNMMNGTMLNPFTFPNGFGGLGSQGFGFPWNRGYGLGGYGGGMYGGGYGYGGYGLDALNPNLYNPGNDSQNTTSTPRRRRPRKEEPPALTSEQERERIHQQELAWSRSNLPANETTSAVALNILLADLQALQARGVQGPEVNIDQSILPSLNVVVSGSNGNIGVLKQEGRINWPGALRGTDFQAERQQIESSILKAIDEASHSEAVDLHDLTGALASLRFRLAEKIQETPARDYIRAKRLLDQLNDAVRLLRQPDAGLYFNQTYAAKGQTVAQLVQYMTRHGLQFAPAVEGGEPAYAALHQTMAEYDLAANSQVLAKK